VGLGLKVIVAIVGNVILVYGIVVVVIYSRVVAEVIGLEWAVQETYVVQAIVGEVGYSVCVVEYSVGVVGYTVCVVQAILCVAEPKGVSLSRIDLLCSVLLVLKFSNEESILDPKTIIHLKLTIKKYRQRKSILFIFIFCQTLFNFSLAYRYTQNYFITDIVKTIGCPESN
jgi:hypothetical protein